MQQEERIDLGALDVRTGAESGAELHLKHPVTGKALKGWVLRVRGYDSDSYRHMLDEHQRRRLERLAAGRRITVEEMEEESLEAAGALVAGWPETFDLDKQPLPYSEAHARALLRRFAWIREQVERFAAERGNFLKGSGSS